MKNLKTLSIAQSLLALVAVAVIFSTAKFVFTEIADFPGSQQEAASTAFSSADILAVMVDWQGERAGADSDSAASIKTKLDQTTVFWNKNSYGKIRKYTSYVYPKWVDITDTEKIRGIDYHGELASISGQLRKTGINLSSYKYVFVILPRAINQATSSRNCNLESGTLGVCIVPLPGINQLIEISQNFDGARGIIVNGKQNTSVYAHEFGHAQGSPILHFGDLECGILIGGSDCAVLRDYSLVTIMGNGGFLGPSNTLGNEWNLSAIQKINKGYLPQSLVSTVDKDGVYELHVNDNSNNGIQAIKIFAGQTIYLDYLVQDVVETVYFETAKSGMNPEAGAFNSLYYLVPRVDIQYQQSASDKQMSQVSFQLLGHDATSASIRITFLPNKLNLTKIGSGGGSVTANPDGDTGKDCQKPDCRLYFSTSTITLTATPNATSTFVGWTGDCSGKDTTCKLTMDKPHTVTAEFSEMPIVGGMHHHSPAGGMDGEGCSYSGIPFRAGTTDFDVAPGSMCSLSTIIINLSGYTVKVLPAGPTYTNPGTYFLGDYNDNGSGVLVTATNKSGDTSGNQPPSSGGGDTGTPVTPPSGGSPTPTLPAQPVTNPSTPTQISKSQSYPTPGTSYLVVPSGVTSITASVYAGGGGGSSGYTQGMFYCSGTGGSAGTYVASKVISVIPGETLTVTVGSGGSGGIYTKVTNIPFKGLAGGNSTLSRGNNPLVSTNAGTGGMPQLLWGLPSRCPASAGAGGTGGNGYGNGGVGATYWGSIGRPASGNPNGVSGGNGAVILTWMAPNW